MKLFYVFLQAVAVFRTCKQDQEHITYHIKELLVVAQALVGRRCYSSEIKAHAIKVLQESHPTETIHGDITKVSTNEIPDFDILCAGFPCQA